MLNNYPSYFPEGKALDTCLKMAPLKILDIVYNIDSVKELFEDESENTLENKFYDKAGKK